jgi:hypothetical protein
MGIYENCRSCNGQGSIKCSDCICPTCKGSGKMDVKCSGCVSGKVTCDTCSGSGKLLDKKGWFSDKYKNCYFCNGSGKRPCGNCSGTTIAKGTCSSCEGSGRSLSCSTCRGEGKVICGSCQGKRSFDITKGWSKERIMAEMQSRIADAQDQRRWLRETEEYHRSNRYRTAEPGWSKGAEQYLAKVESEIAALRSLL